MTGVNPVPARLSERIQRRIDAMATDGERNWLLRVCKERMNALPLRGNQLTHWALRADGTVLSLDADSVSLAFEEELSPIARYAVFSEAAREDAELRELVPPRPPGVQQCERCGGMGWMEKTRESCGGCSGLGWGMQPRPIAEWMERIDRGDQLQLRVDGEGGRGLVAGRLAGWYVARGGDLPLWTRAADSRGRRALDEHLRRFGWEYRFGYQKHVLATWQPNVTGAADPFESATHLLRFSGTGSGGSYEVDVARRPDGRYAMTTALNNDWDPAGGAEPTISTVELDEGAARAAVEREMRESGSWNPFPAMVPRNRR
jgi:hypothetical protein